MELTSWWKVLVYESQEFLPNVGFNSLAIRRIEPDDVPIPISLVPILFWGVVLQDVFVPVFVESFLITSFGFIKHPFRR